MILLEKNDINYLHDEQQLSCEVERISKEIWLEFKKKICKIILYALKWINSDDNTENEEPEVVF
jgi:hypothetical protein